MKKIVGLIVLVLYVASIVFVSYFGLKFSSLNIVVYPEYLVCTNEHDIGTYAGKPTKFIDVHVGDSLKIEWSFIPAETTEIGVTFRFEPGSNKVVVNGDGEAFATFGIMGLFRVEIVSLARSSVTDIIIFDVSGNP